MPTHQLNVSSEAPFEVPQKEAIITFGEVFADGTQINPVRAQDGRLALRLSRGDTTVVGNRVEHERRYYEPPTWKMLEHVRLPTCSRPHGKTRNLLKKSCEFFRHYGGLDDKDAALIGRIPLISAVIDAVPVAPAVIIVGPGHERAARLTELLGHVCRHALQLTGVNTSGFRSLPSGARFTYVIRQPRLSENACELLQNARSRDLMIPFGGQLLNLFGAQIICTDVAPDVAWAQGSLQIWMTPGGTPLPAFDVACEDRVTELQNTLLSFRNQHLEAASRLHIDASKVSPVLRDLARALCTATPDDEQLQQEVFVLLRDQDEQIRSDRWISFDTVTLEAIIVAAFHNPGGAPCVAKLAEFAAEILARRGGTTTIDAAVLGKRLKLLGFQTQRDSECAKLHLTSEVAKRANRLAVEFGIETDTKA
jgi:hypothetical protein